MSELVRFSVSLEADLLEKFDRHCAEGRFPTRSEAIRQLLHQTLSQQEWETDAREMTATLILVYDHHRAGLPEKLTNLQHDYGGLVVATTHVHLDHDHCMEVVILRGGSQLRKFASEARLEGGSKRESWFWPIPRCPWTTPATATRTAVAGIRTDTGNNWELGPMRSPKSYPSLPKDP